MSGAIAGLAIGVGTATFSFIQAGKQKRAAEAAEKNAALAMNKIEKELTKNEMKALSIEKEPYEMRQDLIKSQIQTQLELVNEGDQRGVLAGGDRINQAVEEAATSERQQMGAEMNEIERLVADEETRKSDIKTQIEMGNVQGAQKAAADNRAASKASMMGGVQALGGALQAGLGMIGPYGKSAGARDIQGMESAFKRQARQDFLKANPGATRKDFNQQYNPNSFQQSFSGLQAFDADQMKNFGSFGSVDVQGADGAIVNQKITGFSDIAGLGSQDFQSYMLGLEDYQRGMIQSQMGIDPNFFDRNFKIRP